jgi:NADPH:quinone reductase-like Zn-dependent oxidoreductase
MRAYEIADFGSTGRLRLVERPTPIPGPGEVLLKVRATGVNARDFAIMSGNQHGSLVPPDRIPLCDNAGDVAAVGEGVTAVKPGDRVTMTHYWKWLDGAWHTSMRAFDYGLTLDGFLAEQRVVPAAALVKIPDSLSYDDAATLASAGLTAWQAVVVAGHIGPGDTVVTLGTGGVSVFALQWAKMLGARVIVTSSDDAKLDRMTALGADAAINYRTSPAWFKDVLALTGGEGANLVVNTVGMAELDNCLEATASGGRIGFIGSNSVAAGRAVAPPEPLRRLGLLIIRDITLKGVVVGSRAMMADMVEAMARHAMKPVIDRVYPFDQANDAIAYVRGGDKLGKVVIRVQ